jgi:hypothetical protein
MLGRSGTVLGKLKFATILAAFLLSAPSYALEVGGIIGPGWTTANTSTGFPAHDVSLSATVSPVLGLTVSQTITPQFGIDVDLVYLGRKGTENFGKSSVIDYSAKFIHLPVIAHWSPLPFLNVGAGAYFSHGLGTISQEATDSRTGEKLAGGDISYEDRKMHRDEFGWLSSIGYRTPMFGGYVNGEFRYLHGLTNMNNDKSEATRNPISMNNFLLLVGISFPIL